MSSNNSLDDNGGGDVNTLLVIIDPSFDPSVTACGLAVLLIDADMPHSYS